MNSQIRRPSLGQRASIGSFYDARTDEFLNRSLLNHEPPLDGIARSEVQTREVHTSFVDTYEEKFEGMGIGAELAASVLAGIVIPGGSGQFLLEKRESNQILHASLRHRFTTVRENLNFMSAAVRNCLSPAVIVSGEVTHVVTAIEWGVQSIVSVEYQLKASEAAVAAEHRFRDDFEIFGKAVGAAQSDLLQTLSRTATGENMLLRITAYSDVIADEGILMQDLVETYDWLNLMPLHAKMESDGKGRPLIYTLFPIGMLSMVLPVQMDSSPIFSGPSSDCLRDFVVLFDEFRGSAQELNDYYAYINSKHAYMPPAHAPTLKKLIVSCKTAEETLKKKFAIMLHDVRAGSKKAETLRRLMEDFETGDSSPKNLVAITKTNTQKVDLIQRMVSSGAAYIGYNTSNLQNFLVNSGKTDAYVLFVSDEARSDTTSWSGNQKLLKQFLDDPKGKQFIAILDCDADSTKLEKAHISHFRNGKLLSSDLLEEQTFLADKCFARYNRKGLETKDVQKPLKRRFVQIPCPNDNCNPSKVCDWMCPQCNAPIEYGFTDDFIYCDCGRSMYSTYDFRCNSDLHGVEYCSYDRNSLLAFLKSLAQSNYLNVLILGETGVGKSTFINAFVNYLTFENLDNAKRADKLNWVVPCSFSIHDMDRKNPDVDIKEIEIKVGARADENDGSKGDSATQQTQVYPVTIGGTTIRLIDTPGIGDTRGLQYDKKNMADVLTTLSSYDELHGIMILLKSNNARLGPSFRFCIKELLRHLHRSAATNLVFGFTNTRISNYGPGDTYAPLKRLLEEHPDIGLTLKTSSTTYCFDSESFRYLAAYKNNIFMPNEEDFRNSWTHSRNEALRVLDHFRSKPPHPVNSTLSLNGTRQLISELTKPMAEISQLIRTNIALCEDRRKELKDTRLSGDKLRQKLQVQKILLEKVDLAHPRTVCRNASCTEFKDSGDGTNELMCIYKTHCHPRCYLTNVKADVIAHPGLVHCAAFGGSQQCKNCSHSWQQHMHIMYEFREKKGTVSNEAVATQLRAHADDITLKETFLKEMASLIVEYKSEHTELQKAAAQFALYLKKHSMLIQNDATIDYLKMLIDDEEAKVAAGGNNKRLRALHADKKEYIETRDILAIKLETDANSKLLDEAGVDQLVKRLYNLKHFGKNLRTVKNVITTAHKATNREIPLTIKGNNGWGWNYFQGFMDTAPKSIHKHPQAQVKSPSGRNHFSFRSKNPFAR